MRTKLTLMMIGCTVALVGAACNKSNVMAPSSVVSVTVTGAQTAPTFQLTAGQRAHHIHALLHQQHRNAYRAYDPGKSGHHGLNDGRLDSLAGFIEHEQSRASGERSRHGELLLLSS